MHRLAGILVWMVVLVPVSVASAQTTAPADPPAGKPALSDRLSVTEHTLRLGDLDLRYRATAGYLPVRDEAGKDKANFFFVAYEKLGESGPEKRPVTFVFNGGPGAASVWLHLGTAGPKRVAMADEAGMPPAPPYRVVDNDATWLAATDLVFIDPVGTGYSRAAAGEKPEQFFGVREDVASVGEFIRLYTTTYERWLSPKFLAGESYGTTRAAALSEHLAGRHGITLNGVILISTVLNFQTISAHHQGNDLPYALFLPGYTATAFHFKRLAPELQQDLPTTLKRAEEFASGEYTSALAKGATLSAEQRKTIAERLAWLTGLSAEYALKSDLRIRPEAFRKLLLESEGKIIGRFDARITGFDSQPTLSHPPYDPSLSGYLPAYSAAINDYVRRDLRFDSLLPYEVLSDRVRPWNFGAASEGYLNTAGDLRNAMVRHPHMKVLFASGYFDLATPYFAVDYTIAHLGLSRELAENIRHTYYDGGHMMYHNSAARKALGADVTKFIESAK